VLRERPALDARRQAEYRSRLQTSRFSGIASDGETCRRANQALMAAPAVGIAEQPGG